MKNNVQKSEYFFLVTNISDDILFFEFETSMRDFIFEYKKPFPSFVEQGVCNPLANKTGIYFLEDVVKSFQPEVLIDAFNYCFVYNFSFGGSEEYSDKHLSNDFTLDFSLDTLPIVDNKIQVLELNQDVINKLYDLDSDFFYLRDKKNILMATRDYNQFQRWKSLIGRNSRNGMTNIITSPRKETKLILIHAIHNFLVIILSLPLLILSPITKVLTQLIFALTFGLPHLILHLIRNIIFFIPTLFFSILYETGYPILKMLAFLGLPFSVLGSVTGTLIGFGGEHKPTAFDLGFYACYPLSNKFNNFVKEKIEINQYLVGEDKLIYEVCKNHGITDMVNSYVD